MAKGEQALVVLKVSVNLALGHVRLSQSSLKDIQYDGGAFLMIKTMQLGWVWASVG